MRARWAINGVIGGALGVALLAAAPAIGSAADRFFVKRPVAAPVMRGGIGTFTPVAGDPRLAAALARSGFTGSGFRFTPAVSSAAHTRAVTVAVRARAATREVAVDRLAQGASAASIGIAPVAYNLGVGVGWRRFALSGDVKRMDVGIVPGSREGVDLGLSYNANKWSTRVELAADRPIGSLPRTINGAGSVSLDVGGSYRLTRNLDVMAGVRYKSERDRLKDITDTRRDSQAVYVGTAFRF
jgi:Gram-negative porin